MSYLLLACRVMLAGIFVVSLVSKVRSRTAYAGFRRSVAEWRVVPRHRSAAVAAGAVAGEAGVVLLLVLPWTVPVGFITGAVLLAAFTAGIVVVLRRQRAVTCRCFGASTTKLGATHVVRNLLLFTLCVAGAVSAAVAAGPPPTAPGAALALSVAAIGVLIVVRIDDLVALSGSKKT
jgi:hypothetical protein